jgi:hypothetical protein
MTITEIIQGLEKQQRSYTELVGGDQLPADRRDVNEVCRLSIELALHVRQLEGEFKQHMQYHKDNEL